MAKWHVRQGGSNTLTLSTVKHVHGNRRIYKAKADGKIKGKTVPHTPILAMLHDIQEAFAFDKDGASKESIEL